MNRLSLRLRSRPLLLLGCVCALSPLAGCFSQGMSSADEKKYQIESVRNYVKGKMRKAEYWIGQLIDTYAAAKRAGVPEETLAKARAKHEEAHVLWEFWTAENSDGFHNPDLARETLTGSIKAAKDGVALLKEAMEPKKQ